MKVDITIFIASEGSARHTDFHWDHSGPESNAKAYFWLFRGSGGTTYLFEGVEANGHCGDWQITADIDHLIWGTAGTRESLVNALGVEPTKVYARP